MTDHQLPRPERPLRAASRRAAVGLVKRLGPRRSRSFPPDVRDADIRRILLIRLDLLGDLVLTMPAAAYLRSRFRDVEIDFLTLPQTAPLLEHYSWIGRLFTVDVNQLRPSGEWLQRTSWEAAATVVRAIREREYDAVVSFCGTWASAFALLSDAPLTVGYAGEALHNAHSVALPGGRYDRPGHEAEWCLRVATSAAARRLVGPAARYTPERYGFTGPAALTPLPAAQASVQELLRERGLAPGGRIAVLHAGARNGAAKRWPTDRLAQLAGWLSAQGLRPVLTGTKAESRIAGEIVAATRGPILDLSGQTSIAELVALLAGADLVVSGDSAPMHLAVALGRPVVAIHGPTAPEISGPWGGRSTVVRNRLPCMPCYDATDPAECPLGHHRCLRELTVESVSAAAARVLAGR